MTNTILRVQNLRTSFIKGDQRVNAVDGLEFVLQKGETLGIVGESGSGKTVSCLSLLGLLPDGKSIIESGKAFFIEKGKEIDLLSLSEKELTKIRGSNISIIFQEAMNALNPVIRCGKQIEETFRSEVINKSEKGKKVLELFQKVQLPDPERIYKSYPHQLSGGQLQRIMIAMAIAGKPDLIIADEPTTALDVTIQKGIIELLKSVKAETDASMIFISHDLGVIAEVADHVLVMKNGKMVESGLVDQVLKHPKHDYTKSLIDSASFKNFSYPGSNNYSSEGKSILLQVEELKKTFHKEQYLLVDSKEKITAVGGISFKVAKGEILGLVGESGCGKSTTAKLIMKNLLPDNGKIKFKGKNIFDFRRKDDFEYRKKVQMIFQDPFSSLNPRMPIGLAIKEPMQVHQMLDNDKQRKKQVLELLRVVGLKSDHYNRLPHEFSGGQKQRICIARALALQPELLICDECVSSLDVTIQAQILQLLISLRAQYDLSIIFISHDLFVVKNICDRILVMKNGIIMEQGSAYELFNNPKDEYTKSLINSILVFNS